MVKNYIVSAVRNPTEGWLMESSQLENYKKMYELSIASFRKFVVEPFESILWTGEVKNNEEYTKANWREIWDLWHKEPCNIFWAGADTLMIKPTSLFSDRFKEFRMFYPTPGDFGVPFPKYFNDDIAYYPHTMDESIWQLGEELWKNCDTDHTRNWGFDQTRHNHMFWAQDIPYDDRFHPKLACQVWHLRSFDFGDVQTYKNIRDFNGINLWDAHILHFHASQGSLLKSQIMEKLSVLLGIV